MKAQGIGIFGIAALLLAGTLQPAFGATVSWTDWTTATSGNPGSASGTIALPGFGSFSVSYTGEIGPNAQTSGGINYWIPATPYISAAVENAPPTSDIIRLTGGNATVNTITFSAPVVNPVMAILSLGQAGRAVSYNFNAPFDVLSFGPGYWGAGTLTELPGNVLQGVEGHGTIQFLGTYSSISWTTPTSEFWHGFTVGTASVVPLPGAVYLLGSGLLALIGISRRHLRANA